MLRLTSITICLLGLILIMIFYFLVLIQTALWSIWLPTPTYKSSLNFICSSSESLSLIICDVAWKLLIILTTSHRWRWLISLIHVCSWLLYLLGYRETFFIWKLIQICWLLLRVKSIKLFQALLSKLLLVIWLVVLLYLLLIMRGSVSHKRFPACIEGILRESVMALKLEWLRLMILWFIVVLPWLILSFKSLSALCGSFKLWLDKLVLHVNPLNFIK